MVRVGLCYCRGSITSKLKDYLMACFSKMGMGLGQENERYPYMHSKKSSLVLIVVMLRLVYV